MNNEYLQHCSVNAQLIKVCPEICLPKVGISQNSTNFLHKALKILEIQEFFIYRRHFLTDRQTDGTFFYLFRLLRHTKHEHSSKGDFFFTRAITILSLFTYSVCDEKVKISQKC